MYEFFCLVEVHNDATQNIETICQKTAITQTQKAGVDTTNWDQLPQKKVNASMT